MFGGVELWNEGAPLDKKPYEVYSIEEFSAEGTTWEAVKAKRFVNTVEAANASVVALRERLVNRPVFVTTLSFDSIKDLKPFVDLKDFPLAVVNVLAAVSGLAAARLMAEKEIPDGLKDLVNALFLGTPTGEPTNQSAFIAMFHGLHALILSRGEFEKAPIVSKDTIPTRYMWVLEQLSESEKSKENKPFGLEKVIWDQFVTDIQDSYVVTQQEETRLSYSGLVTRLKAPKDLLTTYIQKLIVVGENVPDNETVLGFESLSLSIFDVYNPSEAKPQGKK